MLTDWYGVPEVFPPWAVPPGALSSPLQALRSRTCIAAWTQPESTRVLAVLKRGVKRVSDSVCVARGSIRGSGARGYLGAENRKLMSAPGANSSACRPALKSRAPVLPSRRMLSPDTRNIAPSRKPTTGCAFRTWNSLMRVSLVSPLWVELGSGSR